MLGVLRIKPITQYLQFWGILSACGSVDADVLTTSLVLVRVGTFVPYRSPPYFLSILYHL